MFLALRSSRSFIINHIVIDAVQQFLICPNKQSNNNVGGAAPGDEAVNTENFHF